MTTLLFCLTAHAAVLEVGPDAPWATIGEAITAAAPGDTIEVAPGLYDEALVIDRGLYIVATGGPEVTTLTSTDGPVVVRIRASTQLTGFDIDGQDLHEGIRIDRGVPEVVLDTLHIHDSTGIEGGALTANSDVLQVRNCWFEENSGRGAGAIDLPGTTTAWVEDSVFVANTTPIFGAGAIQHRPDFISDPVLTVSGCTFEANQGADGGAIYSWADRLEVTGSTFIGNSASTTGGGIGTESVPEVIVADNVFVGNSSRWGGAVLLRGFNDGGRQVVRHNLFVANTARDEGGGVHIMNEPPYYGEPHRRSRAKVLANTFVANEAPGGAHLMLDENTHPKVYSNIFADGRGGSGVRFGTRIGSNDHNLWFANEGGDIDVIGVIGTVEKGHHAVEGDPLFVDWEDDGDPLDDDFGLAPGSPAIDAGPRRFEDPDGTPVDIGYTSLP